MKYLKINFKLIFYLTSDGPKKNYKNLVNFMTKFRKVK